MSFARERGAALGRSGEETSASTYRWSPPEVPQKWGQAEKTHPKIVTEFCMASGPQYGPKSLPKWTPKPSKKHSKTYRVFDPIPDAMFDDFLLIFAAAQPSISLLFTTLSWGSAFFLETEKNIKKLLKNSSKNWLQIHTKSHQKSIKKPHPKIYRKIT